MDNTMREKNINYFSNGIQKYGENFIALKSAQDIQRDAKKKIFKDMVFGNINYDLYGKYYTDANFLDNIITVAQNERDIHWVEGEALEQYDATHPGGTIAKYKSVQHKNTAAALHAIYCALTNIRSDNMNIMYLPSLTTNLLKYRRDFAEFY